MRKAMAAAAEWATSTTRSAPSAGSAAAMRSACAVSE
jgi:hypothetical protein